MLGYAICDRLSRETFLKGSLWRKDLLPGEITEKACNSPGS